MTDDLVVQRTWHLTCPRCAVLYAVKEPPLPGENRTCAKCGATWKPAEDIPLPPEGAKDDLIALVEEALGKGAKEMARIVLAVVNERLLALEALRREHAALVEEIDELVVAVDDSLPDVEIDAEGGQGSHVERIEYAGAALEAQNRIIEEWRDACGRAEHERDAAAAELATVVAERDRLLVEVERLRGEECAVGEQLGFTGGGHTRIIETVRKLQEMAAADEAEVQRLKGEVDRANAAAADAKWDLVP